MIVPDLLAAGDQAANLGPYAGGLVVTAVAARLVSNAGVAVLLGMAGYGVLLALAA
ncbi:hypothetical protein LMG3410_03354 [Achromobacter aegrifaciens]|nr:hypothetical protein LMG3410_03354 [Achromobacter aegrifaciens]